ncbi:SRPBCC domain-containing protein [Streptacidiphilus neutrinimicus]|uniref:SRPBCC domain-containing protein n=1 Tax=Streptacidiphilus neutrinimicus TaxID=105420 RepID=UPI0005AA3CF8|nr:SRPBCC domain-containing protein [Streptacidiphilus neutrinimicus]
MTPAPGPERAGCAGRRATRPRRTTATRFAWTSRSGSVVTFLIEPHPDIVRLTVTHEDLPDAGALGAVSHGWPAVMANLKSLLETGEALAQQPWEMAPGT